MDVLVDFLLNNYIWVLIISLILIFALIGYLVDSTTASLKNNKNGIKPISNMDSKDNVKIHPSIEAYTNDNFDDPLINEKNS